MDFIKNKKAWTRWKKKWFEHQQTQPAEPQEYPCFGYLGTLSWGYEESSWHYLYAVDMGRMLMKIAAVKTAAPETKESK
jgi:hypothetical protein